MFARKGSVLLLTVVLLAATVPTAVVAQDGVDVSVSVDGESVSDGETVEVGETAEIQVNVSSGSTLDYVTSEYNGSFRSEGVQDEDTFSATREVDVFLGRSSYEVTAENVDGDTDSLTVTLDRPARGGNDYQRILDRLSNRMDRLNDTNQNLREQQRNVSMENERLRNETERLRNRLEELNESDGNGLPGFGSLVTLAALLLAVAVTGIRRKL